MIRGLLLLALALFPFVGLLAQSEGGCPDEISSEFEGDLDGRVEELVCVEPKSLFTEYLTICTMRSINTVEVRYGVHNAVYSGEEVQRMGYRSIHEMVVLATGYW